MLTEAPPSVCRLAELIPISRHQSGWFLRLPDNYPGVYSTHHFLKLSDYLDIKPANECNTITTLQTELSTDFQTSYYDSLTTTEEVFLRDYYNAVSSVKSLGGTIKDTQSLAETIQQFETKDGSYRFSRPRYDIKLQESGTTLATEYAIHILTQLDHSECISETTTQWLKSEWSEHIKHDDIDISRLKSLARMKRDIPRVSQPSVCRLEAITDEINQRIQDGDISRRIVDQIEYFLRHGLVDGEGLHPQLTAQILDHQLSGGGYNISGMEFPEPHGTAAHVGVLSEILDDVNFEALQNFVSRHSLQSGGFAKTYATDTSLDNSYYDTEVSRVLGLSHNAINPPAQILDDLLTDCPQNLKPLTKVVRICTLDVEQVRATIDGIVDSFLVEGDLTVEEIYYLTELINEIDYSFERGEVEALRELVRDCWNLDGGYGVDQSTQMETFYAVGALSNVDSRIHDEETVKWVKKRRVNAAGYGTLVQGELKGPFLHNTYLCTSILSRLGKEVTDASSLVEFVVSHGSRNGGFCSTIADCRAFGDREMQFSYWAVMTLANLERI